MRPGLLVPALLALGCAGARAPVAGVTPGTADTVLRAPELARVRCLLVAPLENASDAPLAAEVATSALVTSVSKDRTRVFPIAELRALFRDTPLELPEGVSPSLALELADLVGADGALYGAVEGRARGGETGLLVTVRLVLTTPRDLLFAATTPVRPRAGERTEDAVRRTLLETSQPMLARLGDPGRKRCFDPERARALRGFALAEARAAAPAPAAAPVAPPPPAPKPVAARVVPRTPRQAEWAKQLGARRRFVAEEVAFAGRTPELAREAGLADLAVALAAAADVRVRVEAFADATHDPEADAKLTAAMAQVVTQRLVELGVPRERLSWAGRGGESPLLPNFTVRGRAANRRIEVVGLEDPGARP